ncbi:MAG: hypothetical protein HY378_00730 [Candidatus Brennerbacteria bacterium]|nr:hypothetical protein [Candidatus Brennerbacteria bacterium]
MSKTNKVLLAAVIILVLLLAAVAVWAVAFKSASYYAVFLRSGDLYFGELMRFPSFGLKNVYTLAATGDQQTPISIQRFRNVFWGPEDWLKINRDEVIWLTKLDPQGQLGQLIRTNPDLIPQQPAAGQ